MAVMALHDSLHGGADLLRSLQLSLLDPQLHFLQAIPRPLHDLFTHPLLVDPSFIAVDHEHAYSRTIARNLLNARPRWFTLLLRRDARLAVDPAAFVHAVD